MKAWSSVGEASFGLALAGLLVGLAVFDSGVAWASVERAWPLALSLFGVAVMLFATGAAISALAGWSNMVANPALCIGVGQLCLGLWFCSRSLLARGADAVGWSMPGCGAAELFVVAALTIIAARSRLQRLAHAALGALLPLALAGIAIAALRELPRIVALSSDPDQHAFWTLQLARFGTIPWQQGDWGPLDFQYPAGFALMARLWMLGGSLNTVEAVTVQPLIQSYLAVNALAVWVAREFVRLDFRNAARGCTAESFVLPAALLAGVIFYACLPYSLTKNYLLLQKTGSISSLLLSVLIAAILLEFRQASTRTGRLLVAAALAGALAYTALVNPVAVLIPMALSGVILLGLPGSLGRLTWRELIVGVVVFLVTLLADPYYANRLLVRSSQAAMEVPPQFKDLRAEPWAEYWQYLRQYVFAMDWLRPWVMVPFVAYAPIALAVILATAWQLWRLPAATRRVALAGYLCIPLGVTALGLVLLPVFHLLRHRGDMYLLEPYLKHAAERVAYLWFFASIVFLGLALLARWRTRPQAIWGGCIAALLLLLPVSNLRERLLPTEVRMAARQDSCGVPQCNFPDDLLLAQQVASLIKQLPGAKPPRVLVPNQRFDIWRERWIFPVGFARALPNYLDVPLAFFYGKGEPSFTYRNYVEHVCERLDLDWLKARGVEYLFVPSDHDEACISGLDGLMAGSGVVARVGKAAFIRL